MPPGFCQRRPRQRGVHTARAAGACLDLSMWPASHVAMAARHCALATQQPSSYHQGRRCCQQPHCKSRPEQRHLLHQRVRRQRSVPLAQQSTIYAGSAQANKVSQNAKARARPHIAQPETLAPNPHKFKNETHGTWRRGRRVHELLAALGKRAVKVGRGGLAPSSAHPALQR
jgi:hypothetical protein